MSWGDDGLGKVLRQEGQGAAGVGRESEDRR